MSQPILQSSLWSCIHQEGNYTGHKFWLCKNGLVAITDNSLKVHGRPDTTLDGLLLIDFKRKLTIADTGSTLIPVVDPNNRVAVVPGSEGDIEFCVKRLGFTPPLRDV